jgi:hypothetical protein
MIDSSPTDVQQVGTNERTNFRVAAAGGTKKEKKISGVCVCERRVTTV